MGKPLNGEVRVKRLEYTKAEIKKAIEDKIITEGQKPLKNIALVLEVADDVTNVKKGDKVLIQHFMVFPFEDADGKENAYEIVHSTKLKYVL